MRVYQGQRGVGQRAAKPCTPVRFHSLVDTAPDGLRERLIGRALDLETRELDRHLHAILRSIAAPLLARHGVGYETAGHLLVTAGDNPRSDAQRSELRRVVRGHRRATLTSDPLVATSRVWVVPGRHRSITAILLRNVTSSPVNASTGKTKRHRLNRGGDRHANSALGTIVLTRMSNHPPTRAYVERRTTEGLSKRDIIRCLKRYVVRETFPLVHAIVNQHEPQLAA